MTCRRLVVSLHQSAAAAVQLLLHTLICVCCCAGYERLFKEACERLQEQGGVPVPIDFSAFARTAGMLYTSAFLAERYAGIRGFLESKVCALPMRNVWIQLALQEILTTLAYTVRHPCEHTLGALEKCAYTELFL